MLPFFAWLFFITGCSYIDEVGSFEEFVQLNLGADRAGAILALALILR